MILTGKAKEDFLKWFSNYSEKNHHLKGWHDRDNYLDEVELPKELINALIIEWFDSVGIYINSSTTNSHENWFYKILYEKFNQNLYQEYKSLEGYKNRLETTEQAIIKANEIYNEM